MGVQTNEIEVSTPLSPAKAFKAFFLDFHILVPKVAPEIIKSIEFLEGDGGVGSVWQVNFAEANVGAGGKYVKEKLEAVDKENFSYCYTVIEGDSLRNKLEKVKNEIKYEAAPGGGTILKRKITFYTIGDAEIKEEKIKEVLGMQGAVYKAVEAYVLANPNY